MGASEGGRWVLQREVGGCCRRLTVGASDCLVTRDLRDECPPALNRTLIDPSAWED